MRKNKIRKVVLLLGCAVLFMTGCGSDGKKTAETTDNSEHEVLTMQAPFRDLSTFMDVLSEKYPEINLEMIPYSGQNSTGYFKAQLEAGDMPDIYCTTYYTPGCEKVSGKLIDLSGYGFTDNYAEAYLQDVTDEGAIYMLPLYYDCIGITYNKTLLEKNHWTLPSSLEELEKLASEVKAAGYELCLNETQLPGYDFQYLCDILSTDYLNTPGGRDWQSDFLEGKTTLKESPEMMKSLELVERWRDIGMLNGNSDPEDDEATRIQMAEGNTLFLMGGSNTFTEEESEDEFGLMPFLSEDGTKNTYILNVSRFIGLNKNLEEQGKEQKLEDAIHVMEVLSTVEGMQSLNSAYANTSLLPLKGYEVKTNGYYTEIEDDLNAGKTAPLVYDGWTRVVVPVGETMNAFIRGKAEMDALAASFDDNQYLLWDNSDSVYTTVTEKLDTDDCAKLIGICFAKAVDADAALISKNKWYDLEDGKDLNLEGVSGALYPLPVTDEEIVSILPTGWRGNIMTATFTGARIKELAEKGYDRNEDGNVFPYELVMPEGAELDDGTLYTVAVAGITEEAEQEGNLKDTGISGLDAAREYFSQFETLSEKDIIWE